MTFQWIDIFWIGFVFTMGFAVAGLTIAVIGVALMFILGFLVGVIDR